MSRTFSLHETERSITNALVTLLAIFLAPKIAREQITHRIRGGHR